MESHGGDMAVASPSSDNTIGYERWLWLLLFCITFVCAMAPTAFLASEIWHHGAVWYLKDPPTIRPEMRFADKNLVKQLDKDWSDVSEEFAPLWIYDRTPISLYLCVIASIMGPICCYFAIRKRFEVAVFGFLTFITVTSAAFHLWSGSSAIISGGPWMWLPWLFPGIVVVPLRVHHYWTLRLSCFQPREDSVTPAASASSE